MGWLAAAALVSLFGYAWYAGAPDAFTPWSRFFPFWSGLLLAYFVALRGAYGTWAFPFLGFTRDHASANDGRRLALIWIGAVLFRALLVPATPALSDDVYRYIWDGRVLLDGINPYRYPPQAAELASLRDALWTQINHPELETIYPPLLMLLFAAV
ncbi:MAG TPA: hypothetical protein VFP10_15130, partial [Candidatus Eisenbacteria bacterium]|nr:hypothetical protein [Candidatus Eisenbacteria bacterium]